MRAITAKTQPIAAKPGSGHTRSFRPKVNSMMATTLIFAFAASLVIGYVFTCNRLLRRDENWSEGDVKPMVANSKPVPAGRVARA
jgi:hypothetical protein